ncbi:hypothetical protein YTCETSXE_CDS0028 [Staphylococcus phage MVC_VPHSA2]|uniref:Uncharacterized protein n=1 Tax=Staphylococcus phage MVC_VPHSA1 TaxID=3088876 RepID=A0ABZ0QZ13_9CAUD|nr:hypothetical protein FBHYGVHD_CDS0105 [Staphylococcus phage MVC_VPHSA1]WPF64984.1 hypothetical protein YTCETSXE_CDS0028 [Staphylococcus phage MVC_VPHSA2]
MKDDRELVNNDPKMIYTFLEIALDEHRRIKNEK